MSEQKIERHRLSTLSLQSISFAKKLANTSWLCMLETSVLRKLLEDNEAQKLHWFRKNELKQKTYYVGRQVLQMEQSNI